MQFKKSGGFAVKKIKKIFLKRGLTISILTDIIQLDSETKRKVMYEMEFKVAIKKILKDKKITQTALAEKLGYDNQSSVGMPLSNNNITLNLLLDWLEELDYELAVQPKRGAGKRKDGEYLIERKAAVESENIRIC